MDWSTNIPMYVPIHIIEWNNPLYAGKPQSHYHTFSYYYFNLSGAKSIKYQVNRQIHYFNFSFKLSEIFLFNIPSSVIKINHSQYIYSMLLADLTCQWRLNDGSYFIHIWNKKHQLHHQPLKTLIHLIPNSHISGL